MTTIWILGGLTGVLVALYMARPRLERRQLSAARFFIDLPPARQTRPQLRLSNPLLVRPFYLQLVVLLLLLAALFSAFHPRTGAGRDQTIGLWLLLDSSGSMSTTQAGTTRMALAQEAALLLLQRAQVAATEATPRVDLCITLSTFDMIRQDRETPEFTGDAAVAVAEEQINEITPRALGTDLELIRELFTQLNTVLSTDTNTTEVGTPLQVVQDLVTQEVTSADENSCAVTHLVIITDLPAPDWLGEQSQVALIWHDVSEPVDNSGFRTIRAARDPLSGLVRGVEVTAEYYNTPPTSASLIITGPTGNRLVAQPVEWRGDRTWRTEWIPPGPGQYQLHLTAGGAYTLDDDAVLDINEGTTIRVDWQVADRGVPEQLAWMQDTTNPQLRVADLSDGFSAQGSAAIPTLIVGNGYTTGSPQEILDFYNVGTLLADLNLDVAEQLAIAGTTLPPGFTPVLRGIDGQVWLAQRTEPPAVLVPGLPTELDETVDAFSATAFYNGVRWLLQERPLPPLYTLTTPALPEPNGARIALHESESNTAHAASSYGELAALHPRRSGQRTWPLWPYLLLVATLLFAAERTLALYGGGRWR